VHVTVSARLFANGQQFAANEERVRPLTGTHACKQHSWDPWRW